MSKLKHSIYSEPLQTSRTKHFAAGVLKTICSKRFTPIIIKASEVEFIFSKVPCFQLILLKTFRKMLLKFDDHHLRASFFRNSNNNIAA